MAIVINGTGSISGLSNVGGIASAQSGSVIQTVSAISTTQVTTTSTSYVTTGLSASITPQFSTSKILIIFNGEFQTSNGKQCNATIYKNNTTDLATGASNRGFFQFFNGGGELQCNACMCFLDSPATTSSTTYTIYMKLTSSQSQTLYFAGDNTEGTITLMEIAA